jgi:pimeloyl-ACP methyl ester carboxylesterase
VVEVAFAYAQHRYRLDLQGVSPLAAVATTHVPVFLIHGQKDGNIPARHSRMIAARNPSVVVWEVPGADHCGAIGAAPRQFEKTLISWFVAHPAQRPLSSVTNHFPAITRPQSRIFHV